MIILQVILLFNIIFNTLISIPSRMKSNQDIQSSNTIFNSCQKPKRHSATIQDIQFAIFQHFSHLKDYKKNLLPLSYNEELTTYYLPATHKTDITFYFGHGFGGTSLMYFPVFNYFLAKGNIVVWQVRGMGIGEKTQYQQIDHSQINDFYVKGLEKILEFYNHDKIIFVSHSFSGYITLRYLMKFPQDKRIIKAILLSPIGVTPKELDYKNSITSFSSLLDSLLNSFGWKFNLTFKSPLRTILCCVKQKILTRAFNDFSLSQEEIDMMVQLFLALVKLPDGSQHIFFNYFLPRVLPRTGQSIQQLIEQFEIKHCVSIYYGGNQDWVDKKGAENVASKYPNIRFKDLGSGGHMICLNKVLMKQIAESEIK